VVAVARDAPRPRRFEFPPTRLLFDIAPKEETPSRTPWWLTLLRLTAAALLIKRCRRSDLESAHRRWRRQCAARDPGGSTTAGARRQAGIPAIKGRDELIAKATNGPPRRCGWWRGRSRARHHADAGGTARVALRQLAPKPYSIERVETLPAIERFLKATGDCEIAWLSDGVDTGRGTEFLEGLGKTIGDRALTILRAAPAPLALARRKRRGEDDGEGAAHRAASPRASCARSTQGLADRRSALSLRAAGPRNRSRVRSAGRTAQRHRAAGNIAASARRRGAAAPTRDGAGARSVVVPPVRPTIPRSRCWHRTFYLTRALAPFADVRLGERGSPQQAITQFLDQEAADDRAGRCRHTVAEIRERITPGSRKAACWCVLPARGWRRPMTIW
jgi:hypothetical protein